MNIIRVALLALLSFFPLPSLYSKTGSQPVDQQTEQVAAELAKKAAPITVELLQKMSDAELVALCKKEGIDVDELRELMLGGKRLPAFLQESGPAGPAVPEKMPSLDSLVDSEHKPMSKEEMDRLSTLYFDKSAETVPEPKAAILEMGEKYSKFVDKHIRGRKLEVGLMVGFLLYRQATWIFNAWLIEQKNSDAEAAKVDSFAKSPLGGMLSIVGMNSRLAEGLDLLIRCSFCGTKLWIDLSDWFRMLQQPHLWAHDPEAFFQQFGRAMQRAHYFFSDPLYYGTQLSLIKRVLVGLALPLTWFSLFSKGSPGHALGNPRFKGALGRAIGHVGFEIGRSADGVYDQKISESARHKLFKYSGGILRERLFTDLTGWVTKYGIDRYLQDKKVRPFGQHMAHQAGKYAINHVYTHGVVELLKVFCRHGGLQAIGWVGKQCGNLISKLGFCRKNPFSLLDDGFKAICVKTHLLREDQDVHEVLTYMAAAFPGAFARSVQHHVSRQELPLLEKRSPDIVKHLNSMNGISPYDLIRYFAYNPFIFKSMWSSVDAVKHALPKETWVKVSKSFFNEMIIDAFLNRERLACQYITEPLIALASKPLLHKLHKTFLPGDGSKIDGKPA